jgi:hypothetical protein
VDRLVRAHTDYDMNDGCPVSCFVYDYRREHQNLHISCFDLGMLPIVHSATTSPAFDLK